MAFYTGSSADGSDIKEFGGVYVNPDNNNEWSSEPYPSQRREIRNDNELLDYMNGRYCLNDIYKQIQNKTCKLPLRLRKYVLSLYE